MYSIQCGSLHREHLRCRCFRRCRSQPTYRVRIPCRKYIIRRDLMMGHIIEGINFLMVKQFSIYHLKMSIH